MKHVHVQYVWQRHCYEVFVWHDQGDARVFDQPDGQRLVQRYEDPTAVELKPSFEISEYIVQNLIEALQKQGVQPKQLTLIEGKYEAQSAHLKDLQNLLKKQGYMA